MKITLAIFTLIAAATALATTGSETWSFGLNGSLVTSNQSDLNTLITRANARSTISTSAFGNAYEFGAYIQRRLNGSSLALQLRPSYYFTSSNGSGAAGNFNYSLTGVVIAPLLKYYILENPSVKLYLIGGVNWGSLTGKIQEATSDQVAFSGSNIGYQAGLGTLFCFGSRGQHCFNLEGTVRYLYIERNTADSASGNFLAQGNPASLSQAQAGKEVELDSKDFATSMAGFQAIAGYQLNF